MGIKGRLIKPEELMEFYTLDRQLAAVDVMGEIFRSNRVGLGERAALYKAFRGIRKDPFEFVADLGSEQFYQLLLRESRSVKRDIRGVASKFVAPEYELGLTTDGLVRTRYTSNPCILLEAATRNLCINISATERKRILEARRNIAMSLVYVDIELADPEDCVTNDLALMAALVEERLIERGAGSELYVVVELDPVKKYRVKTGVKPKLFEDHNEAMDYAGFMEHEGKIVCLRGPWFCEVVIVSGKRFFRWSDDRDKEKLPTVAKLQRKKGPREALKDARGWKDVLVAVEEKKGKLRVATRKDARRYRKICRERLWTSPLELEVDISKPDSMRHGAYWDVKNVGRFMRRQGNDTVAGRVEQLITCVGDHISTMTSIDFDNHHMRRGKQLYKYMFPFLWGHIGIDWKGDTDVWKDHVRWWRMRVDHFSPLG